MSHSHESLSASVYQGRELIECVPKPLSTRYSNDIIHSPDTWDNFPLASQDALGQSQATHHDFIN
jgi:hypothetical protein